MGSSAPPPDLTSRVLRHERSLVAVSVATLAAFGWWYIATRATMADMPAMRAPPLGALVAMWWLMMVAMMLPSAAPAILLYARVRQQNARKAVAATWLFVGGYLAMWLLFSVVAAIAQYLLTGPSMAISNPMAGSAVLIVVGLYQLSPLKSACVTQCRSPAQFLNRYWRPGWIGAVQLGVRHGAYCLGCCWMLMALLFVGGVMNLLWVIGLTAVVAVEKLAPGGPLLGRAAGVGLIGWGLVTLAV